MAVAALVVLALVLCVAVAGALQHVALERALRAADLVERVQSMRLASERLRRSVGDLLVLAAGHALDTAGPGERLDGARDAARERLDALDLLAADDVEQRELVRRARAAFDAAQAGLFDASADGRAEPGRVAAALRDGGLQARLQAVGQALDALESHEQRLLARQRAAFDAGRARTEWMLTGGNLLALATMLTLLALAMRARMRGRLVESDARYRVLFEMSPMPMWVIENATGRLIEANAAAVSKYGWTRDAFRDLAFVDPRLADDPEAMRALLRDGGEPVRAAQTRHRRRDGSPLDVTVFVSDVVFRGRPAKLAAIEDMTARLAAERERESMRRRIDAIVQMMSEGFMVFDRDWRTVYVNDRAIELLDRPREALLGRELWALFPDTVGTGFERAARQVAATSAAARVDEYFPKWDRWIDAHIYPGVDGIAVMFRDTTRARNDRRLLVERERLLTELSRKLLRAQEDERRAIARELHDHLLQEMAATKLSLAAARREPQRDRLDARLDRALASFDVLIGQLRNRALDLHPAILEDLGLAAAIDWLCERQRALTGARIVREAGAPVPRLDRETEAAAFRIVQEALSNAVRHAQAGSVRVRLAASGGRLRLAVDDDGVGMDAAGHDSRLRDKLGLISMRERAELLGGRLTIESTPGRGTRVEAELPA